MLQHEIPADFNGMYDYLIHRIMKAFSIPFDNINWRRDAEISMHAKAIAGRDTELEVEFDTALVYGRMGEILDYSKNKKGWGEMLYFRALNNEETEYLHKMCPHSVGYILKDNNPIKQKMITRNEYKLLLGSDLVNRAMRLNLAKGKGSFMETLTDKDQEALRMIGVAPGTLWRDVRNGNLERVKLLARPDSRRNAPDRYYLRDVGENYKTPVSILTEILENI